MVWRSISINNKTRWKIVNLGALLGRLFTYHNSKAPFSVALYQPFFLGSGFVSGLRRSEKVVIYSVLLGAYYFLSREALFFPLDFSAVEDGLLWLNKVGFSPPAIKIGRQRK